MKHVIAVVTLCVAATAFGGTAIFTDIQNDVFPGTPAILQLSVEADVLSNIDTVDLVMGWNLDNDLTFEYDDGFRIAMNTFLADPPVYDFWDVYTNEVYVSGAAQYGIGGTSIVVGQLTVDTTGFAWEDRYYNITIDGDADGGLSTLAFAGESENVLGVGALVHVIPEPTSFAALLGLGALAGLRRRRVGAPPL